MQLTWVYLAATVMSDMAHYIFTLPSWWIETCLSSLLNSLSTYTGLGCWSRDFWRLAPLHLDQISAHRELILLPRSTTISILACLQWTFNIFVSETASSHSRQRTWGSGSPRCWMCATWRATADETRVRSAALTACPSWPTCPCSTTSSHTTPGLPPTPGYPLRPQRLETVPGNDITHLLISRARPLSLCLTVCPTFLL